MYNYSPFKRPISNRLAVVKPFKQTCLTKPKTTTLGSLGKQTYPKKTLATNFFTSRPIVTNSFPNRNKKLFSNKKLGVKKQRLGQKLKVFNNIPKINKVLYITQAIRQRALPKNSSTMRNSLFNRKKPTGKLNTNKLNSSFSKPFGLSYTLKTQPMFKKPLVPFSFAKTNSFTPIPSLVKRFNNTTNSNRTYNRKPFGITRESFNNKPLVSNSITNKSRFFQPKAFKPVKINSKAVKPLGFKSNSFANQSNKNNKFFNNNWLKNVQNVKVKTFPTNVNLFKAAGFKNFRQSIPIKQPYSNTITIPIKYTQPNSYSPFVRSRSNRNYSFLNNKNKFMY